MAYSFNWTAQDDLTDDQMLSYLREQVVEYTDEPFSVGFASDDGGRHIVIYVEKPDDSKTVWRDGHQNMDFLGRRVMKMNVPVGYIGAFLTNKKKDD